MSQVYKYEPELKVRIRTIRITRVIMRITRTIGIPTRRMTKRKNEKM